MRKLILAAFVASLSLAASRERIVRTVERPVPTYSKEVSRIFQAHCDSCHHPGDIAPFSLTTYAGAKPWAAMIKVMTQTHQMPPWKPTPGCGDFLGARTISQDEIDTISRWVANGAPEGNPDDLPAPLDFGSGWTLGRPDLVLSYPEKYTPPSSGDVYRCFPIPTNLTDGKYVSAIDVHPGDRRTVHHVIAYIDQTGQSDTLDQNDPGPGYTCFGGPGFPITDSSAATLGGWAPGTIAAPLPPQVAMSLPASSRVVLQVHYHSHDGNPQPDQTQIGIYFAKTPPQKLLHVLPLMNRDFTIPPDDADYKVTAGFTTLLDVHLWAVFPHMHLLGKSMNVQATLPGGQSECLINIDDWDFNWQGMYLYKQPVAIPAMTHLALEAHYDNSAGNPKNPNNPPRAVSWGEQTTDEMCIAFIGFTLDFQNTPTSDAASWRPE